MNTFLFLRLLQQQKNMNHFFFYAEEMLPEHKDDLMRNLVLEGSHCTAIMLASTCRQERLRYKRLGYKWPFAAARLSAARKGYFKLFKYLFLTCRTDRLTDVDYHQATRRAVFQTPHPALFKWYVGPGYCFDNTCSISHWNVFFQVIARFWPEDEIVDAIIPRFYTDSWGLEPFYYIHARLGQVALTRDIRTLSHALARIGTFEDVTNLGLLDHLARDADGLCRLLHEIIFYGNVGLLNGLIGHMGRTAILEGLFAHTTVDIQNVLKDNFEIYTEDLSIPLIEACQGLGLHVALKETMLKFLIKRAYLGDTALTERMRALIGYAGWTLPDEVKTLYGFIRWLPIERFPRIEHDYLIVEIRSGRGGYPVAIASSGERLINAL
jgi:hypothetical protein